jgi:hypothetical protein
MRIRFLGHMLTRMFSTCMDVWVGESGMIYNPGNPYFCSPGGAPVVAVTCSAGQYVASYVTKICTACPAGFACPSATHMTMCQAGTSAAAGSLSCTNAPAGSYVPTKAASASIICPRGTWQPSAQQTTCLSCAPGTGCTGPYCSQLGSVVAGTCFTCGPGTASAGPGNCSFCPPGTYSSTSGATSCRTCPPGYVARQVFAPLCMSACDVFAYKCNAK